MENGGRARARGPLLLGAARARPNPWCCVAGATPPLGERPRGGGDGGRASGAPQGAAQPAAAQAPHLGWRAVGCGARRGVRHGVGGGATYVGG
jgi:hypothetical protein